jgi:hypothetical protein
MGGADALAIWHAGARFLSSATIFSDAGGTVIRVEEWRHGLLDGGRAARWCISPNFSMVGLAKLRWMVGVANLLDGGLYPSI